MRTPDEKMQSINAHFQLLVYISILPCPMFPASPVKNRTVYLFLFEFASPLSYAGLIDRMSQMIPLFRALHSGSFSGISGCMTPLPFLTVDQRLTVPVGESVMGGSVGMLFSSQSISGFSFDTHIFLSRFGGNSNNSLIGAHNLSSSYPLLLYC